MPGMDGWVGLTAATCRHFPALACPNRAGLQREGWAGARPAPPGGREPPPAGGRAGTALFSLCCLNYRRLLERRWRGGPRVPPGRAGESARGGNDAPVNMHVGDSMGTGSMARPHVACPCP